MKFSNDIEAPPYQSCSLAVDRLTYLAAGKNHKSKSNTQTLIDKMKHESEIKRRQNPLEEQKVVTNEKVRDSFNVLLTERKHLIETVDRL